VRIFRRRVDRFGSKVARGCTSGQALTGGALLSVGSWVSCLPSLPAPTRSRISSKDNGRKMIAPFYPFGLFGNDTALLFAVGIGIGFGFFLSKQDSAAA